MISLIIKVIPSKPKVLQIKFSNKSIFESFHNGNAALKLGGFPAPTARRKPARGNAPGIVPSLAIRPVGAEDPCAPSGRATFVGSRHPGRCPGLASASAFSAGRCGAGSLFEKSFHEYFRVRYLRVFMRWLPVRQLLSWMQHELLHPPVNQFPYENFIFRRARNFVNPSELFELPAGPAKLP